MRFQFAERKGFMKQSELAYRQWMKEEKLDPALREELAAIAGDEKEIEERFYTELAFGTAGLRGIIGAGTNRMNVHVVRRATQGLAQYIRTFEDGPERGVAIAYDSRKMSDVFARETALVLAQNGIKAYLYQTLHSVPQLSFTVRHLNCIAGVVITASHNPPEYNGYKVYWEHGGQAAPDQAEAIYAKIRAADYFAVESMPEETALAQGLLVRIGEEVDEAYYAATQTLLQYPALMRAHGGELKLVYTPLHGSGCVPVRTLLSRMGVSVHIVPEQEKPDPAFPTVKAPNPEDPDAFTLAFTLADRVGADAILATDPDSDRLGVAVRKKDGAFDVLSGNQIGSLLIHYLLSARKENGTLPKDGLVVKSLVSTRMADAICARFGVACREVPTGFRFISEIIDDCERTHAKTFLFGFEESYGFLAGSFSRDKDAICAAMLVAEACVYYRQKGMTLYDVLQEMYRMYGYYKESVKSYTLAGKEGIERIRGAMAALRADSPKEFGGVAVESCEDLLPGTCMYIGTEETAHTSIKGIDVLRYTLAGDAWLCVRPSGTEPKLKLYIGAHARDEAGVDAQLQALTAAADQRILGLLG